MRMCVVEQRISKNACYQIRDGIAFFVSDTSRIRYKMGNGLHGKWSGFNSWNAEFETT